MHRAVPNFRSFGISVKLKKEDQKLTSGSKVGLPLQSSHTPRRRRTAACSHEPTYAGKVPHAFSSRFSSLTNRQLVPSASSAFGLLRSIPASCRRSP